MLTPHFHSLVLDGVYAGPAHHPGPFLSLPPPETEDVARVMAGTARRVMRLLEKRGLASDDDPLATDDPLLATLMAASIRSRIATGQQAGQPWRRIGDRVEPVEPREASAEADARIPVRCVRQGGMSLHADVSVPARDRQRLERLCRYIVRPPLALERLEALPDGHLAYRLKTRWRDGTTHIVMERRELLERLAPLIPPPRAHQLRYHGLLAPCASGRDRVVPGVGKVKAPNERPARNETVAATPASVGGAGPHEQLAAHGGLGASKVTPDEGMNCGHRSGSSATESGGGGTPCRTAESPSKTPPRARRLPWSELLQRVFGISALRCSQCGKPMRVLAAITDPAVARRILVSMNLPPRAPPLAPAARPEPLADAWPGESEATDFDQTPPGDWDLDA